jgi:hypothetical protein
MDCHTSLNTENILNSISSEQEKLFIKIGGQHGKPVAKHGKDNCNKDISTS